MSSSPRGQSLDAIGLEVLWQRLLAILEEAAWTIVRSSFSSAIREGWDFSCLLYDGQGRLLAQNAGVSGKIGVWHTSIPRILERFPARELSPGDVVVTNDPWLTDGHLYDTSVVMPLFRNRRLIGFGECVAHLSDIGGSISNAARDLYEEGLQIPICKLMDAGHENPLVRAFLEENVRTPNYDIGDLRALVAALHALDAKLQDALDRYQLADMEETADDIIRRTEQAMREGIRKTLAAGQYEYQIQGDGFDEPTIIHAKITVEAGSVKVDYAGSSPQRQYGVNCPFNYARAWTVFAIKTIVCPNVPNNFGSFLPIAVAAPEGTILNPVRPAPVRMRASTAHYVTPAVHGALSGAARGCSIAESGSPGWINRFFGVGNDKRPFAVLLGLAGGTGARLGLDGLHALNYPTNMAATSVEVLEETMPILVREKSILPDSGGAGTHRGGCGQHFTIQALAAQPMRVLLQHERTSQAAKGVAGGHPGRTGQCLLNGKRLPSKTQIELRAGDVLEIQTPGGGGVGDPRRRSVDLLRSDWTAGIVSDRAAADEYGRTVEEIAAARTSR